MNVARPRVSVLLGLAASLALVAPRTAEACGGFFCAGGGGGPTPVVQAAERVMFEDLGGGRIRAYVQIQYDQQNGAPIGFSWVVPVTSVPELGVADAQTFQQLDVATAPQFRFVNAPTPTGSSGAGCAFAASADGSAFAPTAGSERDSSGVLVHDESRIGDYLTAVVSGESAEEIRSWLTDNGYDIPEAAEDALDHYVYTGHLFAAFRYDPIDGGTGTLPPVVLTYDGEKPCVPIKITAIASTPILDILVLAFGDGRARPDPAGEYVETVPDYDAIRTDFTAPTQTTYADEVDRAIEDAGRHAFVVEYAQPAENVQGITDPEALAMLARHSYVTRFYTRMTPEQMDVDPEFVIDHGARDDASNFHVIDLQGGMITASLSSDDDSSMATAPPLILAAAGLALVWRRRRR